MNKRIFGADILLLLTAAVWGFGFVAQRKGMSYVGPFTFNGIRFLLGSVSLLPLYIWRRRSTPRDEAAAPDRGKAVNRAVFLSILLAGSCMFIAVSLQQIGIMATTAGNAGFITGLYVIFTPIFGIFMGRKTGKATWIGAVLTLLGLYFLSTASPTASAAAGVFGRLNPGDIVIVVSAVFWAFHVLIIDRLVRTIDPLLLSAGQFAVSGIYGLLAAFILEPALSAWLETTGRTLLADGLFQWQSLPALIRGLRSGSVPLSLVSSALVPILYGGLASVGIGYTLQVVAQRDAPPAHATIILCLEGSFAAAGGILLLGEPVGKRTVIGFALALMGMIISQWELIGSRNKKN